MFFRAEQFQGQCFRPALQAVAQIVRQNLPANKRNNRAHEYKKKGNTRMNLKLIFTLFTVLQFFGCASNKYILPAINGLSKNVQVTEFQKKAIYNCAKLFPNETQISFGLISDASVKFVGIIRTNDTM
jgi:hypothetical protein